MLLINENGVIFWSGGCSYNSLKFIDNLSKRGGVPVFSLPIENFRDSIFFARLIEGLVLTMHDKRNILTELVEKDVRDHFKNKVYKTIIPRNVRVSEAPSHGKPVLIYDTACVGSKAYIELAKEVICKQ